MIFRILKTTTLGIGILAAAHAATIQTGIGGANGLTTSYITGNCGGACVTGSISGTTTPAEVGYNSVVFSGATNGSTAPTPYTGYNPTSDTGGTLVDSANGVTFDMINEGSSSSANAYFLTSQTSSQITVPVGIFGVSSIWTMTNSYLTAANGRDLTLVLTFGSSPTASTGLTTVTIRPIDTNTPSNATASGTERDAVDCSAGTGCTGTPTVTGVTNGSVGAPANPYVTSFGSAAGQVNSAGTTGLSGVSIYSNNLYNFTYTTATGAYANTSGTVNLDDQGFVFSGSLATFAASSYLESVQIKENQTNTGSGVFLSALTINSVPAVPEPSTVMMFLGGLGSLAGLKRFRRK